MPQSLYSIVNVARWLSAPPLWMLWAASICLAVVATRQWFVPGHLIAGGDLFPLNLINPDSWARRMRYVWDSTYAMGGPAGALLYILPITVSRVLRLWFSPAQTQHIVLTSLFAAQFLAMVFLIQTLLPGRRLAAICGAFFYCFNPTGVLGGPALTSMFANAFLPYMAALFIRAAIGPRRSPFIPLFVISIAASSLLSINPPAFVLFVLFMCCVAVYICWRYRQTTPRIWLRVLILGACAVIVNLYWAISLYYSLFGVSQTSSVAAVTNVQDLSFVYQRDSILNMFWLNPIWAWNLSSAYPYAGEYNAPALLLAVFAPALLAYSSLLNRQVPRYLVLLLTPITLILLLICTALHGPWQTINLFLFQHVPFFWLFRQPDTKFLVYLTILYAPLIGYQVDYLARLLARLVRPRWLGSVAQGSSLIGVSALFVLAALPVVTGEMAGAASPSRAASGNILSNRVAIPRYWFDLSAYLSRQDPRSSILVLPNDDFYAMPYRWGYYGADLLPSEMLPNPEVTLANVTTGYTTGLSKYDAFKNQLLQAISTGSRTSLVPFLAAQGIKYVLQRNDIDSTSRTRHILHPQQIDAFLRAQPGIHLLRSFGQLDLYVVDQRDYVPRIYVAPIPQGTVKRFGMRQAANRAAATALGLSPNGTARPGYPHPHVLQTSWVEENPSRYVVHVGTGTGPVVVGLAATYHPQWHICIVPGTVTPSPWTCWLHGYAPPDTHVSPLGFANGWVIDRRGPYTVVIDYEFQHVADLLQILSVLMAASAVAAWAVQSLPDRYKRLMPIKGRGKALARQEIAAQADADEVRV